MILTEEEYKFLKKALKTAKLAKTEDGKQRPYFVDDEGNKYSLTDLLFASMVTEAYEIQKELEDTKKIAKKVDEKLKDPKFKLKLILKTIYDDVKAGRVQTNMSLEEIERIINEDDDE